MRILYAHVPSAWLAYLAFVVTAAASALYLFRSAHSLGVGSPRRCQRRDRRALHGHHAGHRACCGAASRGGCSGQWDARLTSTAFLFVTYLGYLAVRRLGGTHHQRARRSAIVAMLAVIEIPLVHFSVTLWRSLHQEASVANPEGDVKMDGLMLFSLFVGLIAFTLLYVWLVIHRQRALTLEDLVEDDSLDEALRARRAEATAGGF